jgi:hypothetical protein
MGRQCPLNGQSFLAALLETIRPKSKTIWEVGVSTPGSSHLIESGETPMIIKNSAKWVI